MENTFVLYTSSVVGGERVPRSADNYRQEKTFKTHTFDIHEGADACGQPHQQNRDHLQNPLDSERADSDDMAFGRMLLLLLLPIDYHIKHGCPRSCACKYATYPTKAKPNFLPLCVRVCWLFCVRSSTSCCGVTTVTGGS